MPQLKVYQTDANGFYVGVTFADPDQMIPGNWLVPAGAVEMAPPAIIPAGKIAQWVGYRWRLVDKPAQ